jgi:hypothetical protein
VVTNAAGITWSQNFTAEVDGKYAYVAPLTATKRTVQTSAVAPVHPLTPAPPDRNDHTDRTKRPAVASTRISGKEPAQEPVAEPEQRAPEPKTELPPPPAPKPEAPVPAPDSSKPIKVAAAVPPPTPKATPLVAPTAVTKLSGEIPAMRVDGVQENFADVIAKLCIDEYGRVSSVKIVRALPVITDELQHSLEAWHYKPYANASGQVTPACFPVTFRVVFKHSN